MRFSYCDGYTAPLPEGHVFPMGKFEGLKNHLINETIISAENLVKPALATIETLKLFHTEEYIFKILNGGLTSKEERRLGLTWSPQLADRSRYAVQGTINAAIQALEDGVSANLAGGTHHAMPDHGEGFCVFNDVAISIKHLLNTGRINSALIIDLDVHQGNGNAIAFKNDERVYTVSVHGEKNYPFKKPQSDIDIGLPDKINGGEYIMLLEDILRRLEKTISPDIVFYLAGIDVLSTDRFGRIDLNLHDLTNRDLKVCEYSNRNNIPLCGLLSGGYAPTLEATITAHAQLFKAIRDVFF